MILTMIMGLIIASLFVWGVVFSLFFGFVGLAFKSVFHAAWFAVKYIALPAGIVSYIICKLKNDAEPKKVMIVVSVIWVILFSISLNRNFIIEPLSVDDVGKIEMSSYFYDDDGELVETDTVEMTSEKHIYDGVNFYNNVELKKVLKENIHHRDERGTEIGFVYYDKDGKEIQSIHVYDGYKMSITKNGITKYYARFDKSNVFSISQMDNAVQGVHIKERWNGYLEELKNSMHMADSNTFEFTVPEIQPEENKTGVGKDYITVYYKYTDVRDGQDVEITRYLQVDIRKERIELLPGETVRIDLPEGSNLNEFTMIVEIYDYNAIYTENINILDTISQ